MWNFVQIEPLEAPALLLPHFSNSCCVQNRGLEQISPNHDRRINDFYEFVTVFWMPEHPFFECKRDFYREQMNFVLKFCHVISFYVFHASFVQFHNAFAEKPDTLFRARLKEKVFAFVGKWLEHLDSGEILFCHCLTTLNALIVQKFKLFEGMHSLFVQ